MIIYTAMMWGRDRKTGEPKFMLCRIPKERTPLTQKQLAAMLRNDVVAA